MGLLDLESTDVQIDHDLLEVLESLPDAVTVSRAVRNDAGDPIDIRLEFMNARARAGLVDPEPAIGQRCSVIWPEMIENGSFEECMEVLRTGEPALGLFRATDDETSQPRGYDYKTVRVGTDRVVCVLRDISEQLRTAAALAEIAERHRTLLETLTEGVLLQDDVGFVLAANESAARILGVAVDQLIGHPPSEWAPPFLHSDGSPMRTHETPRGIAILTGRPQLAVVMGMATGDEVTWLLVNSKPLFRPDADRPYAAVTSFQDMTASYDQQRSLAKIADRDELTGTASRRVLLDRLAEAVDADADVTVLFVDLDAFKAINDQLGHAAGDQVLRGAADRLRGAVRDTDLVARLGGDEFVVLCKDLTHSAMRTLVARIEQLMSLPLSVKTPQGDRTEVYVGASVGHALACPGQSAAEILSAADAAMYDVKRSRSTALR